MCVVSNMGDIGRTMWPQPWVNVPQPLPQIAIPIVPQYNGPTREQFAEFLELLKAARKFDVATGQKDCPMEEKISWLRDLAKHLGIDPLKVSDALK